MSSQEFMWLNLAVALLIALVFFIGRRSVKQPSKLNMRNGNSAPSAPDKSMIKKATEVVFESVDLHEGPHDGMRSLTANFMFNGHSFDAYEVLGIPSGSNWPAVEQALKIALTQKPNQERIEFLKAAVEAIKRAN